MHRRPRFFAAFAMLSALCLAGPSAAECLEPTVSDERAVAAHPREQLLTLTSTQQALASQIAAHPAFDALTDLSLTWAARELDRQRGMAPRNPEAHVAELRALVDHIETTGALPQGTSDLLELTSDDVAALGAATQDLTAAFPTLLSLPEEVRASVIFHAAEEQGDLAIWLASAIPASASSNDDGYNRCIDLCALEFAAAAASAMITYGTALAACTLAGPTWPLCVASATAAYGVALYNADQALKGCQEDCINPPCYDDSDCPASEYCWKGALGLGDAECRDKKEIGQVCSRHGKCESGCCKLHIPTNPFSKTCRPAYKCD